MHLPNPFESQPFNSVQWPQRHLGSSAIDTGSVGQAPYTYSNSARGFTTFAQPAIPPVGILPPPLLQPMMGYLGASCPTVDTAVLPYYSPEYVAASRANNIPPGSAPLEDLGGMPSSSQNPCWRM